MSSWLRWGQQKCVTFLIAQLSPRFEEEIWHLARGAAEEAEAGGCEGTFFSALRQPSAFCSERKQWLLPKRLLLPAFWATRVGAIPGLSLQMMKVSSLEPQKCPELEKTRVGTGALIFILYKTPTDYLLGM